MSDTIDDVAELVTATVAKPRRRTGDPTNPVVYALANGLGLVMTRISVWLIAALLAVIGWTGNSLLSEIDSHLSDLKGAIVELKNTVGVLQVDVAVVKQHQADQDAKR